MNQIEREFFGLLDMTHKVRDEALRTVTAEDLEFALPGNPALGELIVTLGNVEFAYTESFRDFRQDFARHASGSEDVTSGDAAAEWLHGLDNRLKSTLSKLTDDDLGKPVDRGGWQLPVMANFHTYREAVLIIFGKMDCYFRALGKQIPGEWSLWVG